jgi:hypothetical protein
MLTMKLKLTINKLMKNESVVFFFFNFLKLLSFKCNISLYFIYILKLVNKLYKILFIMNYLVG